MSFTSIFIIGALGIVAIVFGSLNGHAIDKKEQELENKKAVDQKQLDTLQKEQSNLKDVAATSQVNATEDQKKEFWNVEINSNPNSNK